MLKRNEAAMFTGIAQLVKEQMNSLGMSVEDLSEKSGVQVETIENLLSNNVIDYMRTRDENFPIGFLMDLAKALELPSDIFTGLLLSEISIS